MNNSVRLQVYAERLGDIREVIHYLTVFEQVYNHLYAFDLILQRAKKDYKDYFSEKGPYREQDYRPRPVKKLITIKRPEQVVLQEDRLRIIRVVVKSPGVWEFLGKLNPLEVLRQYLCDRHERKKDIQYRNRQERERGELEIEKHYIEVVREKIDVLREVGVPEEEIRKALFDHVEEPFRDLGGVQDKGLVRDARLVSPSNDAQAFADDAED